MFYFWDSYSILTLYHIRRQLSRLGFPLSNFPQTFYQMKHYVTVRTQQLIVYYRPIRSADPSGLESIQPTTFPCVQGDGSDSGCFVFILPPLLKINENIYYILLFHSSPNILTSPYPYIRIKILSKMLKRKLILSINK